MVGIEPEQFKMLFATLKKSRDNARALAEEVQFGEPEIEVADAPEEEPRPVAFFAADDRRAAWYTPVLDHLGLPMISWREMLANTNQDNSATQVIVDFHGAAPAQRLQLDRIVQQLNLTPVVIGDIRHTPTEERWQGVPHLPDLFNLDEIANSLSSADQLAI